MREIKLLKCSVLFIIFVLIYYLVYLNHYPSHLIVLFPTTANPKLDDQSDNPIQNIVSTDQTHYLTWDSIPNKISHQAKVPSVIVFVHIQKTGGTLIERRLVKDGIHSHSCQCFDHKMRCLCQNPGGNTWLFSRYSTGWACGLHADLTELKECVQSKLDRIDRRKMMRTYDYFTILRDPVNRYISEWLHVKRGSTWHTASLRCHGRSPPTQFYQPCYTLPSYTNYQRDNFSVQQQQQSKHLDWSNVPLKLFLQCPYNLASNRQTRMLANLSRLGCYRDLVHWTSPIPVRTKLSDTQARLLRSAKLNLAVFLACFGLNEHLVYSQYLVQKRLGIIFKRLWLDLDFLNQSLTVPTHASLVWSRFNESDLIRIRNSNRLDLELYAFARHLFLLRLVYQIRHDSGLPYRFRRIVSTLWSGKNSNANLIGLEHLILIGQKSGSFRQRLNLAIMNLLVRRGSKHAPIEDLVREQGKRLKKLARDLGYS